MWTLAPSLVATTQVSWGELRSLATGERWDVRPEDLPIVRALGLGIPDAIADMHRELPAAVKRGWAVQADSTADAYVRQRIEMLERRFGWLSAAVPNVARDVVLGVQASRRHWHHGFAQHTALPETVARRAALVGREPQNVLVLGDDDFVSLALVQLGHRVTVIGDANAQLVHRCASPDAQLDIIAHDLREPLPAQLVSAFDAFLADPLSGPGALRLVLARGLAALKADRYGFICVSEAGAHSFEILTRELGVDVTDHYSDFNHYYSYDYNLDYYVSDLVVVRCGDRAQHAAPLRPAPDEPYLVRGLTVEDQFLETPITRYTFKDINVATSQLVHLDAAVQLLERAGLLQIRQRSYYEKDNVRTYLVHTKEGSAVFVRLLLDARVGELFVAPTDTRLEDAIITVLLGTLRIEGTVVHKHRVRGSSVFTMT